MSNNTVTPPPTSSPPPPPASSSVQLPPSSSNNPPPASSQPSSNTPAPSSDNPSATSTITGPSAAPSTTDLVTSVITPSATRPGETPQPSTVVVTRTAPGQAGNTQGPNGAAASPTTSDASGPPGLQNPKGKAEEGGLSTGGKTAIAVVVPVVVVALLVIAGILLWRRRKSKKSAEEARRKEVEEYGFNPNEDPTLPPVGMQSEMAEDQSGYRGWGNTATSSNRKASTTLTSGMTYSDSNSNPGGYQSPGSPTNAAFNDAHSGEPLMDGVGVLGAGRNANQNHAQNGVQRGTSNASSSYSAAERSDNSGDYPMPMNHPQELYNENNQGYYHASPYDPNGYAAAPAQPIIRDVSARRNTRIESPSVFPQQGNSGIAQNF